MSDESTRRHHLQHRLHEAERTIDRLQSALRERDAMIAVKDERIKDLEGALRFILAFYDPGQTHLDTEAWKRAESRARYLMAQSSARAVNMQHLARFPLADLEALQAAIAALRSDDGRKG